MNPTDIAQRLALPWIVRLRYGMILGEIALLLAISIGLQLSMPAVGLGVAIALQAVTNILFDRWRNRLPKNAEHVVGVLFVFDVLCLTLILATTGGPTNPFSLLYLVQITFSAVILHRAWTWALGIISTLSFGLLFWVSRDVAAFHTHPAPGELSLHLLGMWIAFATAALLISHFIGKVSEEARNKEAELLSLQKRLARNERLASLVTLAAGAAHEIATPLATIAISAKEMERDATNRLQDERVADDARLIRAEVERCRLILERMGAQGADPLGEAPSAIALEELLRRTKERFPHHQSQIQVEVDSSSSARCVIPARAAIEALGALVKNALDASPSGAPVVLRAQSNQDHLQFLVRDEGSGMSPEIMDRVVEPFFTTKQPGQGMGLGAFLAHLFAQRLGGSLSFESSQGRGCTATMELPATSHVER
jgi:two-component system sensor histidine kinase RegB